MMRYRYRALSPEGEIVAGEVDARSREEVAARTDYLGLTLIEAGPAGDGARGTWRRPGLPRSRDVTVLLREIALLLGSGLTLDETLRLLAEDAAAGPRRTVLRRLSAALAEGSGFAEAVERCGALVSPAGLAMIRAGEASGRLSEALGSVVEDRQRVERLSARIAAALRYPLFLIASAALVLLFFLLQVVPQFEPVFQDLRGDLNPGARTVLALSAQLREAPSATLALLLGPPLAAALASLHPRGRSLLITAVGGIPGAAGLVRDAAAARILGALAVLLGAGVTLPAALKLLQDSQPVPAARIRLSRTHDQVRSGRRFADALAESGALPPLAIGMVRVGEEAGALPTICAQAARFYEDKLTQGLDRLMGAVGPAAIILVSLVVGGLVVSIMSALLSLTEHAL